MIQKQDAGRIKQVARGFYNAIESKNIDHMVSFFADVVAEDFFSKRVVKIMISRFLKGLI